jgi:transcriptional regulator of acetoin/glycerol metabolism
MKFEVNTFNLKELERLAAVNALEFSKGNVQFARELLNVSKATIYRIFRDYNIDYLEVRERYGRTSGWKGTVK